MSDRKIIKHTYDTYGDVFTMHRKVALRLPLAEFKIHIARDFENHFPAIAAKLRVELEQVDVKISKSLGNIFTNTEFSEVDPELVRDLQDFNQRLQIMAYRLWAVGNERQQNQGDGAAGED